MPVYSQGGGVSNGARWRAHGALIIAVALAVSFAATIALTAVTSTAIKINAAVTPAALAPRLQTWEMGESLTYVPLKKEKVIQVKFSPAART